MKDISVKKSLLVLIFLSSVFLLIFYSPVIFHANQYIFSSTGDGISSYYNSIYHIEHDSSYINFEGMNYPYGEHISYSVNNPLFTNILKFLNGFFPGLSHYTVGILNFSMIFSFLLTSIFLFLILNQLKINRILAVFSSVAIMMLSPQIFRMQGHLSLAYGFCIPLTFWILMQVFFKKYKEIWLGLLLVNSVVWIFVHPYYTGMISAFILSFALFLLIIRPSEIEKPIKIAVYLILVAVVPIVLYKIFHLYTDIHQCRTTTPWGFLIFTAEPEGIFLPHHPPFKDLGYKLFKMNDQNWEGLAYIGLANDIVLICLICILIRDKFRFKRNIEHMGKADNNFLKISFWASIVVLLFSTGFPFSIYPKYVPRLFNFLNEFRSPGRFAWIFFYISSIFCVWLIHRWVLQTKIKELFKYSILFVFTSFPIWESLSAHLDVSQSISGTPNYFSKNNSFQIDSSINEIKLSDYQAIIPMPYYHRGSENFTKSPTDKILMLSELYSAKSGLPIMSSYLARTSIGEARKLMQVLSPPWYSKPIKDEIAGRKPFLLLYSNEEISENEMSIIKRSELLNNNNDFSLYKLEFDSLFKIENEIQDTTNYIVKEDYEEMPSNITYSGTGAFQCKSEWNDIYRFPKEILKKGYTYEISFWVYTCGKNCGQRNNSEIILHLLYRTKPFINWYENPDYFNPYYSQIIDNCWSKVKLTFKYDSHIKNPFDLYVAYDGKGVDVEDFFIDELRVRQIPPSNQN